MTTIEELPDKELDQKIKEILADKELDQKIKEILADKEVDRRCEEALARTPVQPDEDEETKRARQYFVQKVAERAAKAKQ